MSLIGLNIKRLRQLRGRTQSQLAADAGIIQPRISQIENGLRLNSPDELQAIARALGVAPGMLLQPLTVIGTSGAVLDLEQ